MLLNQIYILLLKNVKIFYDISSRIFRQKKKIKKGEKIYEVRLNKNKYKDIKINDFITFNKKPDLIEFIETKVDDILYFTTFNEMVNSLSKELIGFKNY